MILSRELNPEEMVAEMENLARLRQILLDLAIQYRDEIEKLRDGLIRLKRPGE